MKKIIFIYTLLFLAFAAKSSLANSQMYTCSYNPGDIQPIKVKATTLNEARNRASEICFDRRMNALEARGEDISEERGMNVIDTCANICG